MDGSCTMANLIVVTGAPLAQSPPARSQPSPAQRVAKKNQREAWAILSSSGTQNDHSSC